jgi:hypothetical protein
MNGVGKSETPENAEVGNSYRTEDGEEINSVQNGIEGRFIRGR